jgi:sugar phosphate isomerase/epimerase
MQSLNRRRFLTSSALAVAAAAGRRAQANPLGMPIGIQPYTVRNEMQKDPEGTLKQLAAMGYREIEVADPFYGKEPAEIRDLMKSLGLTAPSGHYPSPKDNSDWARTIERARTTGVTYMITTAPREWTKSLDGLKRAAERFNELGAECKKSGAILTYHNHNFEYKTFDGKVAYDELLRLTDADLVKMEMDCFWTTIAGRDPVEHLEKYPGKFALLHVKGLKKGYAPTTGNPTGNPFTEVGSGVIDYVRIFKAAPKGGVKHYFVEQDNWDRPPLESARLSCEYLKKLTA